MKFAIIFPFGHTSLEVPNVQFIFDVSVDSRNCLTDILKSNSTLGTHFHAMIRTHHSDFDLSVQIHRKPNNEVKFNVWYFH